MMRVLVFMLIAMSTITIGCEHNDEMSKSLQGTDWRLTAWSESSLDPSQFTITIAFDDSRVSGTSAVNSYPDAVPCIAMTSRASS